MHHTHEIFDFDIYHPKAHLKTHFGNFFCSICTNYNTVQNMFGSFLDLTIKFILTSTRTLLTKKHKLTSAACRN